MAHSRPCYVPELLVQLSSAYIRNVDLTFENAFVVTSLDPLHLYGTIASTSTHKIPMNTNLSVKLETNI